MVAPTISIINVNGDSSERQRLTRICTEAGYSTTESTNAAEAIQALCRQTASILLVQDNLPDCDLSTFCRQLRQEHPATVIVVAGSDFTSPESERTSGTPPRLLDILRSLHTECSAAARMRQWAHLSDEVFWLHEASELKPYYVSPTYARLWDAAADENGSSWLQQVHPDDRERVRQAFAASSSGAPYDEEFRLLRNDGREVWVRDRLVRDPDTANSMRISRDISASKLVLASLSSRGETLGTVAHDLRNALAPLRSAIAIINRVGNEEQARKPILAMMEKQVAQMVRLIDQLSDEARQLDGSPLPERLAIEVPQAQIASPPNRASSFEQQGSTLRAGKRRVLVADDSSAVQDSVGALLRSQGYEVRTASNGVEALETAQSWLPDFVFVDMRMPKLDGFGLARRLRADYPTTRMKIILMSGISLDAVLVRHAKAAGFDECIDKVSPPEQWFIHLQDD